MSVSFDFGPYSSLRRKSAAPGETREMRKARATTLDRPVTVPPPRVRKADAGLVLHIITGLVEAIAGDSLDATFGFSTTPTPAYGRLVGLNIPGNLFSDVRAGFNTAINENGLTAQPPRLPPNSANKTYLTARAFGVSAEAARDVTQSTPRSIRRFDEFAALTVDVPSLQAALDAGNSDGLPAGLMEVVSALLGATMAAVRAGDTTSLRLIGEDFGSLAAALFEATNGETAQRTSRVASKRGP